MTTDWPRIRNPSTIGLDRFHEEARQSEQRERRSLMITDAIDSSIRKSLFDKPGYFTRSFER